MISSLDMETVLIVHAQMKKFNLHYALTLSCRI